VIYTSLGGARNTLWKVSIDGGTPQQLTEGSIIVKPVVSPDGKSIACAFRKDEADKWKIAILPFEGGEPRQVLDMPKPYNQVLRWTPDSQALFFLVEKRGIANIWKQPLDGSPAEQITQFTEDQIYHYDRSKDGNGLVLARGRILRDIVLVRNPDPNTRAF
jgi:Tol biopolymer transport system component